MITKEQAKLEGCGPKKYSHIRRQLRDLDVQPDSWAWHHVGNQAIHAAEIMTMSQLTQLIEDHVNNMPLRDRQRFELCAL